MTSYLGAAVMLKFVDAGAGLSVTSVELPTELHLGVEASEALLPISGKLAVLHIVRSPDVEGPRDFRLRYVGRQIAQIPPLMVLAVGMDLHAVVPLILDPQSAGRIESALRALGGQCASCGEK